jgi:hypothetical protein
MKSEADFSKSKIFPHLEELSMDKDVDFYAATKKSTDPVREQKSIAVTTKKEETKKSTDPVIAKATDKPISSEQNNGANSETIASGTNGHDAIVKKEEAIQEPEVLNASLKKVDMPASTLPTEQKKDIVVNSSRPEIKKQDLPVKKIEPVITNEENDLSKTTTKKSDIVTTAKSTGEKKINSETVLSPAIKIPTAAAFIQERKMVAPQVVTFKSDSLELALYDNGEIDGDTVSILLNGEILMAKQGLKASAIRKTIYVQPGSEEITLVLYAENLGKYPPNTGLLVVHDGEDTYQIRFSADLQQNASVVFRRKK